MTSVSRQRVMNILWWFVVPVGLFVVLWMPYALRNLALGLTPWYRIPLVFGVVFDVTAYLQPVAHAMRGAFIGGLLGPFVWPIRALALVFPSAHVAEVWLVTSWVSQVAALWVCAWAIQRFAKTSVHVSRLFSFAMWLSFVSVLGLRPAVFSWFLPLGMFGMASTLLVRDQLTQHRLIRAILWSVAGILLSSVYAWYVIIVALWLGVVWLEWLVRASVRRTSIVMSCVAAAASVVAIAFSWWISYTPAGVIWLELYQRLSLSYTHFPFVSSSLLLSVCWCVLLVWMSRRTLSTWIEPVTIALSGWLCVVFGFLLSPFTGVFVINDHFRAPAVILSWWTLALFWSMMRERAFESSRIPRGWQMIFPVVIGAVALAYVLRIVLAPFAWNGDLLNVVQLSHWFALCVGVGLVLWSISGRPPFRARRFFTAVVLWTGLSAVVALSYVYTREFAGLSKLDRMIPVFQWVETHVPITDSICTDHGGDTYSLDDVLSAHTGRVVHFAHTTLYHQEPDIAYLDRMRTAAAYFDVRAAGDAPYWQLQSSLNQFILCENFPVQRKILRALGYTDDRANDLIGCPQRTIDARWSFVEERIETPVKNDAVFRTMCPWVVMTTRTKPFWHLPEGYREHVVTDEVSVWSAK